MSRLPGAELISETLGALRHGLTKGTVTVSREDSHRVRLETRAHCEYFVVLQRNSGGHLSVELHQRAFPDGCGAKIVEEWSELELLAAYEQRGNADALFEEARNRTYSSDVEIAIDELLSSI